MLTELSFLGELWL